MWLCDIHFNVQCHRNGMHTVLQSSKPLLKVFWIKTSVCRYGTLKTQPNKIGTTPQYFHTIPTSCAILLTIPCICCVHRRVVEGSGVGSAGCVVHVDMYGEWVVVGGCNLIATEHGMGCHICWRVLWSEQSWVPCWWVSYGFIWWVWIG